MLVLVNRNTINFYMSILRPVVLLNTHMSFINLSHGFLGLLPICSGNLRAKAALLPSVRMSHFFYLPLCSGWASHMIVKSIFHIYIFFVLFFLRWKGKTCGRYSFSCRSRNDYYIFSPSNTSIVSVSLYLICISCEEHIIGSFIYFDSLSLSTGLFYHNNLSIDTFLVSSIISAFSLFVPFVRISLPSPFFILIKKLVEFRL